MTTRGAFDRAIKSRSLIVTQSTGMWHNSICRRIVLKMIESQPLIKRVITAKIKTDENTSGALEQDPMDDISYVSFSRTTWRNLGGPSLIQRP